MTASKTSKKKHLVSHVKKTTTNGSAEGSTLHVAASPSPSPEVSTPSPTLVTSAAALAPAIAAAAPPITPPGDLPPAVGAPAPPAAWVPTPKKKRGAQGHRPRGVQLTSAQAVAKELSGSATYSADFGSRAPAAAQVAFVLTNAAKWRDTWQAAKRFFVYASEQRATWENDALAQMDALKPAFEYAASRDGTVAEKYAATAKYLGEANAIAARGVTVRKARAKAKKGTQATVATIPASPEPAPIAAPAGVTAAAK
jgi:hypothetical protein